MLEPQTLHIESIDNTGYIKNIAFETIVLASNNILDGEIYSNQEKEPANYFGSSPFLISFDSNKLNYNNNKTGLNKSFIHNLSTNRQKIHQIRAP